MSDAARKRTVHASKAQDTPRFLKLEEAAAMLQISRTTAKKLAAAGQLPGALKVGKQWRVSLDMLEDHMRKPLRRNQGHVKGLFPRPPARGRPGSNGAGG